MSLQTFYRPNGFNMFAGNETVKKSIMDMVKRENPPTAFLIVGPSGCGKTTLGRIIAKSLGCHKNDYKEVNTASDRSIKGIRAILDDMKYAPMNGKKKVVLFDECFYKETSISTINGEIFIKDINIGDTIFNLNGIDTVEKIFINKIPLNRIVKINKTNGVTFCSIDHLYHIDGSWNKAKDLTDKNLLCYDKHTMLNIDYNKRGQDDLSKLQKDIYSEKKEGHVLFQDMYRAISCKDAQQQAKKSNSGNFLRRLWELIFTKDKERSILFPNMCKSLDYATTGNKKQNTQSRSKGQNKKGKSTICFDGKGYENNKEIFRENENVQSYVYRGSTRESQNNQTYKRHTSYLDRKTRGKRAINRTPENSILSIGMGDRGCCTNYGSHTNGESKSLVQKKESSYLLQSGCGAQKIKNCNRGRWGEPQTERKNNTGSEEGILLKMERVESVEVYKRGSNDKSFLGVIGDKERNQGYIEFYDLQIKTNPSYIANRNMVHNCHGLLSASQEALLKGLEEPPSHIHFICCTTNPEVLKENFKRRCHIYEVSPLTSSNIIIHVKKILAAEKIKNFPQEILDKIIELSNGSLGIVLKNLDMVIDMGDDVERALDILKSVGTSEAEIVDICRTIVNFNMKDEARWNRVRKLLADFNGDGESARRPMLAWFSKCLLNNKMDNNNDVIAIIMSEFRNNFYDDGKSGLIAACYSACDTGERDSK